jgi:2-methylcitrate dehydratase PrpD
LLGLDAAQTKDALSLMLCQNVMPGEIKYSRDTVLRAVREAFPAQAAVTSALLARAGVRGFEQPIEGRAGFAALFAGGTIAESDLLDELGDRFYVAELAFKPWPSCRGTHPFVEMALDLGNAAGFKPRDVTEIRVWVDEVQSMLVEPTARKRAPTTIIDAKFSIPYCVAAALVRGRLSLDDFSEAELLNPEILSVAAKVKSLQNGVRNSAVGGKMEIRLKSGERIQRQVTETLGSVRRPLPSDRLAAKFLDCARRARHPPCARNADAFLRKIDRLEDLQNVMPLLRLLDGV